MHVVLVRPEIAPNTGAIIRLCANTGAHLHLVEPLGFTLDDTQLRRAGLDYHEYADLKVHASLADVRASLGDRQWFGFSSGATRSYAEVAFDAEDVLVFGTEGSGLAADEIGVVAVENRLRIPMQPNNRSMNLANAVAVVVYEAWRQQGFAGSIDAGADGSAGTGMTTEHLAGPPFDL